MPSDISRVAEDRTVGRAVNPLLSEVVLDFERDPYNFVDEISEKNKDWKGDESKEEMLHIQCWSSVQV